MRIDPLLAHYPVRIREVTIGVILFLTFTFYFFPRFLDEGERINFSVIDEIETFDIPQTEQIKIPEPPARPSVPVASEDEFFDEDITIEDTDFDDFEDDMKNKIPMKRFGERHELENLASYLMSDGSAYINGEVVTIDGGEWIAGAGEFSDLTKLPESMWKAMAESRKKK